MTEGAAAYEFLADCAHCHTEAAVVTVMDPSHPAYAHGVPLDARCRMCGHHVVADGSAARVVAPPGDLRDPHAAAAALAAFAANEGETIPEFCASSVGLSAEEIVRRLVAGERIPTNFDVIAWLFPGGGHSSAAVDTVGLTDGPRPDGPPPLPVPVVPPPGPRVTTRALASVMVADGLIRPDERAFVDAWLAERSLPPIVPSDLRVWRPEDLGSPDPAIRDALVDALTHLAHLDAEPDDAEWRVVIAYARAWGADEAAVFAAAKRYDARYATSLIHLWRRLTRMVRTR